MELKFEIKVKGKEKFQNEFPQYYNLINEVYSRFEGKDYNSSSMGTSFDLYHQLVLDLINKKPKFLLELGSGYTTYLMSKVIQDYNLSTKLLSLENNQYWLDWLNTEKLNPLNCVVLCELEYWKTNEDEFVRYVYDYDKTKVDYVFLDGPGHFNVNGTSIKHSINYNYYDILTTQNKPIDCLIDGRKSTQKFYQKFYKENNWEDRFLHYGVFQE